MSVQRKVAYGLKAANEVRQAYTQTARQTKSISYCKKEAVTVSVSLDDTGLWSETNRLALE